MLKDVNWLAIVVAVVLLEIVGYAWYAYLFAAPWTASQSFTPTGDPNVSMSIGVVITLILVVGLSWALRRLGAAGLGAHLGGAFALWFFFDFTTMAIDYVYVGHQPLFVAINMGYQLAAYLIAAAVLALMPRKVPASTAAA
ncbi:MAG: DUF1761 domain-containing protein [Phenylobacterium sp.]|uniref:DUF1761 domain-containing protein n=1 Tax=Phenylobacterium sp. TaxID=1871053 RepID=UPI00391A32C1